MRNMRSNVALRLLPLIAVMGLGVAAGATHAATTLNQIKITSGSDLYTCILNGFSVSSGGVVSATVASCNPALGGSGGGENPDPGGGENPDPGGGENPDPGGGENPGGSVGGADPGSGTWSPDLNGSPLIVVVDQSGGAGATMTVIPGCVNGGSHLLGSSCSTATEYEARINGAIVPVKMTKGQILSIRYPVSGTASGSSTGTIKVANSVGGSIGIDTKISLSTIPGDMTGNGQPRCVNQTTMTPSISTGTTAFSCKIDRTRSMYYLNVAVQQNCTGSNCVFYVSEGSSEFR